MLSKNKIKLIQSLNRKKDRDENGLFLVEGNKMVEEAIASGYIIETLIFTNKFFDQFPHIKQISAELIETDKESIQRASLLQNPQDAMAIVRKPTSKIPELSLQTELYLSLDFIQDPGNLGTILRIADWFGIHAVICSENTVDVFNPKVVQASMGAIFRVKTIYTDLSRFIEDSVKQQIPVYGTFMDGENIYTTQLSKNGIIVMGNEGNGISEEISPMISRRITIPNFSDSVNKSESLNVAIATSICCSEFRRKTI